MAMNYTEASPGTAQTVTNNKAPAGFYLVNFQTSEDIPINNIATLEGAYRVAGIPVVGWQITYLTLSPIGAGVVLQESVDGTLTLIQGGVTFNNLMLIGGAIQFRSTGKGVIAFQYTQNIVSLGQRSTYA